jgi:hypothetical protein
MAAEKKRYLDLSAAFIELKSQLKEVEFTKTTKLSQSFSVEAIPHLVSGKTRNLSPKPNC